MGFKQTLSKGLKGFGRVQVSQGTILTYTALLLILFIAFTIRVMPMRWEIPTGTLGLNEFDPYYQYTITNHMVQYGILSPYWPTHWINTQQFYPGGIDMGQSLPSLPMTTAILYNIISFLGVNIDLISFCSLMAPLLGTLAVLVIYFIGKDMGGKTVGLFSALIMALGASVIQRSSLGFFDTETVGVLSLLLFVFLFLRSIDQSKSFRSMVMYSLGAGGALAYFAGGWGAAYYLIGLAALFVFVLVLMKRYSQRLLFSYSITFGLGLFFAAAVPFLGPHYLTTGVVLPVAVVFALLCLAEVTRAQLSARTKTLIAIGFLVVLVAGVFAVVGLGDISNIAAKFGSVLDPFTRQALPILESVAEHRITAWGSIYYELGIGILFFLVGIYFAMKNPTNRNVFLVVFGLTALYFAGSMVRLLVLLTPAFALLASIGIMGLLKPFFTLLKESGAQTTIKSKRSLKRIGREYSVIAIVIVFLLLMSSYAFVPQNGGTPRVYSSVYTPTTLSAASLPITPNNPVPQWRDMLSFTRNNLQATSVVASWWDYGDWLGMYGNVTTLCDNTTTNTTQIENVAYAMMANETQAIKMLSNYDAQYILVFPVLQLQIGNDGSLSGVKFSGYGDDGKWYWMARISGEAKARLMTDQTFGQVWMNNNYQWLNETSFGNTTTSSTGAQAFTYNDMGLNSTVYKLMAYAEQQWAGINGVTASDQATEAPLYFTQEYISGLTTSPSAAYYNYGGLVPLVALYKINYASYNAATGSNLGANISP